MPGKTGFWSDAFLDYLDGTPLPVSTPWFVALFSTAPTDAYTAAIPDGVEVDYGGDSRKQVIGANWGTIVDGTVGRKRPIDTQLQWADWDGGSPVTVVAFALLDLLTLGEMIYWTLLTTPRTINTGESATFDSGAIEVQED